MKAPLLLACAAALASGCGPRSAPQTPAAPAPAQASPPARLSFTASHASNALATVQAFVADCTPRDGGTPGSERAALWLRERLARAGVAAELDRFTDATPDGPKPFVNVLAELPGSGDTWIVLLSHFDTKSGISPEFQGANDGGSSTALLLELADLLHASPPLRAPVLCAFLDGEECRLGYSERDGFHGSRRLAARLKQEGRAVKAVLLMDMVGDRDLKLTLPRNGTASLRLLALEAAETTGDRAKIGLFDGEIFDDHQAFLNAGYPAIDLIDFAYGSRPGANDYWHTLHDTPDKLSADSLLATGRIVTEMLNRL